MVAAASPPLRLNKLLDAFYRHQVRGIIFGSVAARLYGVEVTPGDVDFCPELSSANLERLARVLREVDAHPQVMPGWITPAYREAWKPEELTESTINHLFETKFGNLDVVPRPYCPHNTLRRFDFAQFDATAETMTAFGVRVRVVGRDHLATCTGCSQNQEIRLRMSNFKRFVPSDRMISAPDNIRILLLGDGQDELIEPQFDLPKRTAIQTAPPA